ncbi:discoidin domain-containing protein [Daejeonella sp.]|uniref:discoidin domain-containing protein n=1 Tax=Daejeonella sp. TaxID=2805397 RepID=UPI0030C2681D
MFTISEVYSQQKNLALGKSVTANSENPQYPVHNVVDGKITRNSKWMSDNVRPPHILEIDLKEYCNISGIVIHTGIPDSERSAAEFSQAAGFFSAKNFKLQYWDDANWTDIPNTEVHENRLTEVKFSISPAINTFRLRFVCDDGEPINIMELQVFGTETGRAAPVLNVTGLEKKSVIAADQDISIKIEDKVIGKSMKYVGYNQGYYLPGSNASGWVEYSGVNSLRIWTSLNSYVPLKAVEVDKAISSVEDFDKRKMELRNNPENNKFLKWDILLPLYKKPEESSTNPMVLDYVLSELKRLKIDPVVQVSGTDFSDLWSNKWQQWQRFYALAYYMAKTGDVTMLALQNEPNHRNSGPMKLDQWISAMQIVSDALTSAIADVNKKYGKNLKAQMVGPVTAGNNPEWWTAIAKNVRTDYHGKPVNHDLISLFSTHSYNSPAAGYANRVKEISKIISDNHPSGTTIPVVYTEIGRWMNAYLIDKEETMDSPSLFTEWAGIYSNNTRNGAYGMWAFKFANTTSDVYSMGIKSGHHFTWQGKRIIEDAYKNLLENRPVKSYNNSAAGAVTDGLKSDISSWKSDSSATEKWLEFDLGSSKKIGSSIVYTGSAGGVYTSPDRIKNFSLQYYSNGEWKDIPGTVEKANKYAQLYRKFKQPVETNRVRFISDDPGVLKVREIKVFAEGDGPSDTENYDVSGIQRTGEVVRLFAEGFKEERPLYSSIISKNDENLDVMTSYDAKAGNYYIWLVQRGSYADRISLDLSSLGIATGVPVTIESVSHHSYGEVTGVQSLPGNKKINIVLMPQSVMLLTIPKGLTTKQIFKAVADATVSGGKNSPQNYGTMEELKIALDASRPDNNQAAFIRFSPAKNTAGVSRALLKVNGRNATDTATMRFHVYAVPGAKWDEKGINWSNAPQLNNEGFIKEVGRTAFVAGELAFNSTKMDHYLDVTDILKNHPAESYTFIMVRETRQMGDDEDKGRTISISSKEGQAAAQLEIWYKGK